MRRLEAAGTCIQKVVASEGNEKMDRDERKRVRTKKRKKSAVTLLRLTLVAILLFSVFKFFVQQSYLNDYDKKIGELTEQISEEEKQKKHYEEQKKLYETDEYQKQLARERLGLVEEHEKIFVDVSGQ